MIASRSERARRGWYGTVIAGAAVACGGHPVKPEVANHTGTPVGTPIERAHAYERGIGVPRDYRAAAELYRAACDDGRGDVAACGALIRAVMRRRGADPDGALLALASRICVDRRDAFACLAAGMEYGSERDTPEPLMTVTQDVLTHLPECDAAHRDACEAHMLLSVFDISDSSGASRRRHEFHLQLCSLGFVEGCKEILLQLRYRRGFTDEADAEVEQGADARRRLAAACDAGDADACVASPDRKPIPPKELCAANDYQACGAAGCLGDAPAARLAASHGVRGDCDALIREYEHDKSP